MTGLWLAAALALGGSASVEQLYAEGRCADVEAIASRAPAEAAAAYFAGACALAGTDPRTAEALFTTALASPEWTTLATFMRGLARLKDGRASDARDDLEAALRRGDLPADLAKSARELLATTARGQSWHGAVSASFDEDTNPLQDSIDDVLGLPSTPSPAAFVSGVALFDPAPDWRLRAILLQRQVFEAPDASVGALLLDATRRFVTGRWTTALSVDGGGYLLGWAPLELNGAVRGEIDWASPAGARAQAGAGARWQAFAGDDAGLTGPDAAFDLEVGHRLGAWSVDGGLDEGSFWTRDPDFARDGGDVWLELGRTLGPVDLRLRATGGAMFFRHVNSLPDLSGERAPRLDERLEIRFTADYALTDRVSLFAELLSLQNASTIDIYAFRRELARVGATVAF